MDIKYVKYYDELSKLEKGIVKKFDTLNQMNINWTVVQTADHLKISSTTLHRLVKKLGYPSFLDFKQDIINSFATPKFLKTNDIIVRTYELLGSTDLVDIIKQIFQADKIIIAGYGLNHYISRILELKLQILGLNAKHSLNAWYTRLDLKNSKPNDVIICITKTGKNEEMKSVFEDAQKYGLNIIVIIEENNVTKDMRFSSVIKVAASDDEDVSLDTRLQMHVAVDYLLKSLEKRGNLVTTNKK